jgi:uncharacterized repeat protein (TIGR01451 family)
MKSPRRTPTRRWLAAIRTAAAVALLFVVSLPGSATAATCSGPMCGVDFSAVAGVESTDTVGSLSTGGASACDIFDSFSVGIDWGDSTSTSAGTVVFDSCSGTPGSFVVSAHIDGTHTYAAPGTYTVTLTSGVFVAEATATVRRAEADLSVTLSAPASVERGSIAIYMITVANAGADAATNVTMTDQLPFGVSFEAVTATGWTCTSPSPGTRGGVVTCTVASLSSGGETATSIGVKIRAQPNRGPIINAASVTSDVFDPNLSDNTASVITAITK